LSLFIASVIFIPHTFSEVLLNAFVFNFSHYSCHIFTLPSSSVFYWNTLISLKMKVFADFMCWSYNNLNILL
jgi:hypothetical protein